MSFSHCTPPKFNKVSLPYLVDVHTICLFGETMLNCVLAFFTSEYLIFFTLHDDPAFLFSPRRSSIIGITLYQFVAKMCNLLVIGHAKKNVNKHSFICFYVFVKYRKCHWVHILFISGSLVLIVMIMIGDYLW